MTKFKRVFPALALFFALLMPAFGAKPVTDDFISDTVRQHLAADSLVKGGDIDVQVKDGVVTRKGAVHEQKQKEKAERIAKKINGVKSVVNNLKVEKP